MAGRVTSNQTNKQKTEHLLIFNANLFKRFCHNLKSRITYNYKVPFPQLILTIFDDKMFGVTWPEALRAGILLG